MIHVCLYSLLGKDLTLVAWGTQLHVLWEAAELAKQELPGFSYELIDLRTILPWDSQTVIKVIMMFVLKAVRSILLGTVLYIT